MLYDYIDLVAVIKIAYILYIHWIHWVACQFDPKVVFPSFFLTAFDYNSRILEWHYMFNYFLSTFTSTSHWLVSNDHVVLLSVSHHKMSYIYRKFVRTPDITYVYVHIHIPYIPICMHLVHGCYYAISNAFFSCRIM